MKVPYQGKEVEVIEIEVIRCSEPWTECQLSDGKLLMFKDVVFSVFKAITETNPDGSPLYVFQTHRVVRLK
jgi:hypothetical protein